MMASDQRLPVEIIRDLRDIHLPAERAGDAVAGFVFWPLLLLLMLLAVGGGLLWWRRRAWRREAEGVLLRIEAAAREGRSPQAWAELAELLRRLAIRELGRDAVARLTGEAWLRRLDQLFASDRFSAGPGRALLHHPYAAAGGAEPDLGALTELLRRRLR
jgi:hypothetical protein